MTLKPSLAFLTMALVWALVSCSTSSSGPVASAELEIKTDLQVLRVAGADRYETANATALAGYPNGAESVRVASGGEGSDALVSSNLPGKGPLLLVPACGPVPLSVLATVAKMGSSIVTIVGGSSAVSPAIEEQLREQVSRRAESCGNDAAPSAGDRLQVLVEGFDAPAGPRVQVSIDNGSSRVVSYGREFTLFDADSGDEVQLGLGFTSDLLSVNARSYGVTVRISPHPDGDGGDQYLEPGSYRIEWQMDQPSVRLATEFVITAKGEVIMSGTG